MGNYFFISPASAPVDEGNVDLLGAALLLQVAEGGVVPPVAAIQFVWKLPVGLVWKMNMTYSHFLR